MKFLLIIFSVFITTTTFACLNGETKFLNNGFWLFEDFDGRVPRGHSGGVSDEELPILQLNLETRYLKTDSIKYLSDYGLVLIFIEDYHQAITLYQKIDSISPGLYSTASNIGTAYELIGNNDLALKWIKESYKINPNSHHKSEWIHINILKIKTDSTLSVSSKNLINTSFGDSPEPQTTLSKSELDSLEKSIYYQLNERMTFIHGKNEIIATLLFDLANISLILNYKEDASRMYNMANGYGYNSNLLKNRIKLANQKEIKDEYYKVVRHNDFPIFIFMGLIIVIVIGLLVLVVLLIRKKKS